MDSHLDRKMMNEPQNQKVKQSQLLLRTMTEIVFITTPLWQTIIRTHLYNQSNQRLPKDGIIILPAESTSLAVFVSFLLFNINRQS
jgi:hypothetical protein